MWVKAWMAEQYVGEMLVSHSQTAILFQRNATEPSSSPALITVSVSLCPLDDFLECLVTSVARARGDHMS